MSHRGPNLVPAPRKYESLAGSLDISRGFEICAIPSLREVAGLVATWLGASLPCVVNLAGEQAEKTPADSSGAGPARDKARLELSLDASFAGREEYRLEVSADQVSVVASSTEGLVRGASTLWQLVLSAAPDKAHGGAAAHLKACVIEDAPRFAWRGFMLDTARKFFPVDFIEKLLDLAALHKLNIFHWHLTDDQAWRLDLPSLPELAREGSRRLDRRYNVDMWKSGSYSKEDVGRIVAYAALRGITVVPEIESPGHATALLASHPELSCASGSTSGSASGGARRPQAFLPEDRYGIFEDILCAGNEASFAILESVIDEVTRLFPGPFVHMGGDEAPKARWLACPRCRQRMEELGFVDSAGALEPERLQSWFMARVAAILAARGKRLVGWDEIIDSAKPAGEGLPADAIVMSWRGYSGGLAGTRLGHEVVMCPQTKACYLDHKHLDLPGEPGQLGVCTVKDSYEFEAHPPGLDAEEARRILGGQANIWSELMYFGRQVEYMAFPRLCALSEAFWSPKEGRDFEDFARRLPVHLLRLDTLGVDHYRGPLS